MPTLIQLCKYGRKKKNNNCLQKPALLGCPQKKGRCLSHFKMSPKKPNSANREVLSVKVTFKNFKKTIYCAVPGSSHNLGLNAKILIRGGRTKDLPALKYKAVRNKYHLLPTPDRVNKRSKHGRMLK